MDWLAVKACFVILSLVVCLAPLPGKAALSVEALLAEAQDKWQELVDISLFLSVRQYDGQGSLTGELSGWVWASQPYRVMRLEVTEPDILEDQVFVLNEVEQTLRIYMPVTEQVLVRNLGEISREQGLDVDFERLTKLPSQENFDVELVRTEKVGEAEQYVLRVQGREGTPGEQVPGVQYFWVDTVDLLPRRIEAYGEDDCLLGVLTISDVVVNPSLALEDLVYLPEDAQIIEQ
ncbi:MAG: outer membrane lipoprotein-sorting protein [Firmicutes bacterium]|nr:outer membrane lipoprotein-sorting protein [Bacillota bacterium]